MSASVGDKGYAGGLLRDAVQLVTTEKRQADRSIADDQDPSNARQAWMREMERAQLSHWFKTVQSSRAITQVSPQETRSGSSAKAVPKNQQNASRAGDVPALHAVGSSPAGTPGTSAPSVLRPASSLNWLLSRASKPTLQAEDAVFLPMQDRGRPEALRSVERHNVAWPTQTMPLGELAHTDGEASVDTLNQIRAPDTAEAVASSMFDASPRVHTRWTGGAAQVWLGLDGTATRVEAQASVMVKGLQRVLHDQGYRLDRVVCNGRVVFDPSSGDVAPATQNFSRFLKANQPDQEEMVHRFSPTSEDVT